MKKILITILSIFTLAILGVYTYDNGYVFSYTSPYNYTKVYPYIAKSTKHMNSMIYNAVNGSLKEFNKDAKVVFVNGYGSGFVKGNDASSDYDYSAGINLGKYKYTGDNEMDIAKSVLNQIARFQNSIYSSAEIYPEFEVQSMGTPRRIGLSTNSDENIALVAESIKKGVLGKPYSVILKGRDYNLTEDELILPDYVLVKLYSKEISYAKNYRNMLREFTVYSEFYVDIETESGIKTYEMVTESFGGKRDFQAKFKKFIPNVFTDFNSIKYAHQFYKFDSIDEYIDLRMSSYCSHFMNPEFLDAVGEVSPIKVIKRILQDVYSIYPILPKKEADDIIKLTTENLQDEKMIIINDCYVLLENIKDCTKTPNSMKRFVYITSGFLKSLDKVLKEMKNEYQFTNEELKPFIDYYNLVAKALVDIDNLQPQVQEKLPTKQLYELMAKYTKDKDKLFEYSDYMNKVLETAGIHKIQLWQDRPNHVYIVKDDFTKNIPPSDFAKLEPLNGFQVWAYNDHTKFDIVDKSKYKADLRDLLNCWVRYKTTPEEDAVWKEMQDKLVKDKRHYNLKLRFGIAR